MSALLQYLTLLLPLFLLTVLPHPTFAQLQVMQISDFHFDIEYSRNGDPKNKCHTGAKMRANRVVVERKLGTFGDYACDSPLELVKNSVQSAAQLFPKPDLILWTGDNVPHIDKYDQKYSANAINTTTRQLKAAFPNVQLLPTYGNHDHSPANQFAENDPLYVVTYDMWKDWIGEEAKDTFLKGGYYRYDYQNSLFLVLNTNLYYTYDTVQFKNPEDPADQFKFMEDQLEAARKEKTPVNIVAHIAPGMYERKANFKWFQDKYNAKFLKVVNQYQDVIKTMIFGHHHTDTFHVVRDEKGNPVQVAYMCPAVTPWYSDLGDAANNPAFRIYKFESSKNWSLKDIETYYVDLVQLNKDRKTKWQLEYSFQKTYNLKDFTAKSLDLLLDQMDRNDTLYLQYLSFNSVLYKSQADTHQINATHRIGQMCSLRHADYEAYSKCLSNGVERLSVCWLWVVFVVACGWLLRV